MKITVKFQDGSKNTYDTSSDLDSFKACFPGADLDILEVGVPYVAPAEPTAVSEPSPEPFINPESSFSPGI